MKKPFLYASGATLYIVIIVFVMNFLSPVIPNGGQTVLMPMTMLALFVLSTAVIGFLFLYEPFSLYMENRKQDAITSFAKIVGIFACFVVFFLASLFLSSFLI